jgi:ectoine hydroxylase-related dioxygenase (phytanoyl-CoA dioxygenase family)
MPIAREWRRLKRLPDLEHERPVPEACLREYRERGHTVVRGLASPEAVAAYRPALLRAAPKGRYDHRPLAERDTYGKAFIQMFNLWTHDEEARAFVFARRFAGVAAALMGVEAVRLYHDQALFKEPGGGATPWHQDQFYWPLDTEHTITMWMPLVPVTPEMGPMEFASGSHHLGSLGDFAIGDESQQAFDAEVERRGLTVRGYGRFSPGDASFHAGWTLHRAPVNRSTRMREVMTVIYFADGTRVGALDHPSRRFDRDVWLPGCEPGEPAASRLNPVLYRRDPAA